MTIPEWAAIIIVSCLLAMVGAIFKYVVRGQKEVEGKMIIVGLEMARLCGKMDAFSGVQNYQERTCSDRHAQNSEALKQLHVDFMALRVHRQSDAH